MQAQIFSYNWNITNPSIQTNEFRFGEAEPVDPENEKTRKKPRFPVFRKPDWLKHL